MQIKEPTTECGHTLPPHTRQLVYVSPNGVTYSEWVGFDWEAETNWETELFKVQGECERSNQQDLSLPLSSFLSLCDPRGKPSAH